jgi:hypothetical protein
MPSSYLDIEFNAIQIRRLNPTLDEAHYIKRFKLPKAKFLKEKKRQRNRIGELYSDPAILTDNQRLFKLELADRVRVKELKMKALKKKERDEKLAMSKAAKAQKKKEKENLTLRMALIFDALEEHNIRKDQSSKKEPTLKELKALLDLMRIPLEGRQKKDELIQLALETLEESEIESDSEPEFDLDQGALSDFGPDDF